MVVGGQACLSCRGRKIAGASARRQFGDLDQAAKEAAVVELYGRVGAIPK